MPFTHVLHEFTFWPKYNAKLFSSKMEAREKSKNIITKITPTLGGET